MYTYILNSHKTDTGWSIKNENQIMIRNICKPGLNYVFEAEEDDIAARMAAEFIHTYTHDSTELEDYIQSYLEAYDRFIDYQIDQALAQYEQSTERRLK